ncbi:hypothetical protein CLOLEP_02064 [[Clostridium] leptum DSM 753]|uniref:Uncharacterized protein n=1 Tax=[Clostridium] leptum DSM 753 TaxID=428125 RepID=A7VU17_9FIRM|nr:hypothetical protein CLOLEP_02064 [[Clostridium] leptum DSM 753]
MFLFLLGTTSRKRILRAVFLRLLKNFQLYFVPRA